VTLTHKSSAVERRQQASRGPTTADHRTYRQMRLKRTSYDPRRLPCKMYAHWLLTRIPLDRRGARSVRSLKPLSRLCSVCSPLLRNTANTPPCSQLSRQSHRLYSLSAETRPVFYSLTWEARCCCTAVYRSSNSISSIRSTNAGTFSGSGSSWKLRRAAPAPPTSPSQTPDQKPTTTTVSVRCQ